MSAKKNSPGKSGAQSKPGVEHAADSSVTIEFSCEGFRALEKIGKGLLPRRHRPAGEVATYVLNAALMHWHELLPLIISHEDYAREEGFYQSGTMPAFCAKTIARKFKLPSVIYPKREVAS